jgi:hypothetical protein
MPEFGWLEPSGEYHRLGNLDQEAIRKCPHFIIVWEHYRPDGTCRCDDKTHTEMKEWEYTWDEKQGRWI